MEGDVAAAAVKRVDITGVGAFEAPAGVAGWMAQLVAVSGRSADPRLSSRSGLITDAAHTFTSQDWHM